MSTKVMPLRKCVTGPELCPTDVHWAAEQAMLQARTTLGWSRDKLAQQLRVSLNTVKRYERGDTTIQPLLFERSPVFAQLWRDAFERRKAELLRAA